MATVKGDVRMGAYTLRMDFNALCDAEDQFPGIMRGEIDIGSPTKVRSLMGYALAAHHPDLTDRDVGNVISEVGAEAAVLAFGEALTASFPSAEVGESTGNPPKAPAKAGTGKKR